MTKVFVPLRGCQFTLRECKIKSCDRKRSDDSNPIAWAREMATKAASCKHGGKWISAKEWKAKARLITIEGDKEK